MNAITVTNVETINNVLRVYFKCKGKVRKFFNTNTFFVEYDTRIEDVPESILVIPFLATVCPVAWACKADVYVETVDEKFLATLKKVQKTLQKFYPKIDFDGTVQVKNIVKNDDVNDHKNSMMLFSCGVDSILTYIKHQNEKPVLVVVNGADVHINNREAWNTAKQTSSEFAKKTAAKLRTLESNCRSMLNELMLAAHYDKNISFSWWAGVMHGLALLGLCAPLTHIDKISKIYLASSYTKEFLIPWGSHPEIDNNVRWAGTTAIHDGYEFSRQEKLFEIAKYIKDNKKNFVIRTCWEQQKNVNCSVCEKCSLTILELERAGIDPNMVGYEVNSNTFRVMKNLITHNCWLTRDGFPFMWKDIKNHIKPDQELPHPEAKEIMTLLMNTDFEKLKSKQKKSFSLNYRFWYRKYLPYSLYNLARKICNKI